jgi:hypothetical protein
MTKNFKLINESSLDQISQRLYKTLLERFGEPIKPQTQAVGIADEGSDGKALWDDEPKKDRPWSDPNVVKEADDCTCNQCGTMKTMEGDHACTCEE